MITRRRNVNEQEVHGRRRLLGVHACYVYHQRPLRPSVEMHLRVNLRTTSRAIHDLVHVTSVCEGKELFDALTD